MTGITTPKGARKGGNLIRTVAGIVAAASLLSGCATKADGADGGRVVNLAIGSWTGYEANAAVITYLLEKKLGYTVKKHPLPTKEAWQGFSTGKVDVILENWGHPELKQEHIEEKKVAVSAGLTGNKGVIGWYIPTWLWKSHPDIIEWENLNRYADLFKTKASGNKGQILDGDPNWQTNDAALIANLGLNYTVVNSGSEEATVKAARHSALSREPLLFYFWSPSHLHQRGDFMKVNLPPRTPGCDADPKKVRCDYPVEELDKIASRRFAENGGRAYDLIRKFEWTDHDQNSVSYFIVHDGLSWDEAAKKWLDAHPEKWEKWLT